MKCMWKCSNCIESSSQTESQAYYSKFKTVMTAIIRCGWQIHVYCIIVVCTGMIIATHTRICRIIVIKLLYFRFDCRMQLNDTFQILITYLNDHLWMKGVSNPAQILLLLLQLYSILFLFGQIISFGYLSVNRLLCVTSQS